MGTITVDDLTTSANKANAAPPPRQAPTSSSPWSMGATLRSADGGVSGPLVDFAGMPNGLPS